MILACTHSGNINGEPVLLYFYGICDFGWKNKRNMGRKKTPPFAKAPFQRALSVTNGTFHHNICINALAKYPG